MTPPHILLVDDYTDALEVWTLYLETSGFSVAPAATGAAALTASQQQTPHAAVLDLQLPDMSGLDLARHFRAQAETRSIPLIALTGRALPAEIAEARSAGFDTVLIKPCDPSDLLDAIRQSLDGKPPDA